MSLRPLSGPQVHIQNDRVKRDGVGEIQGDIDGFSGENLVATGALNRFETMNPISISSSINKIVPGMQYEIRESARKCNQIKTPEHGGMSVPPPVSIEFACELALVNFGFPR